MNKKVILYILIFIVVALLVIFTFFPNLIYIVKNSGIIGNSIEDKCTPPEGTSEEEWFEHMNHHPNIYKECLG